MNTTLSTETSRTEHQHHEPQYEARRVGLTDRLALHLGVALITWGRRPYGQSRERRANRVEARLAQLAREREYQRQQLLTLPVR